MSQTVEKPLTTEQRLGIALTALSFYANSDNWENEMSGYAFVPETSAAFEDRGERARKALKAVRQ